MATLSGSGRAVKPTAFKRPAKMAMVSTNVRMGAGANAAQAVRAWRRAKAPLPAVAARWAADRYALTESGLALCEECAAALAATTKLAALAAPEKGAHYYQSLPCFGHEVYKCCGMRHEEESRRAYYRAYYAEHEVGSGKPGAFRVLERPYTADRILADGTPYAGGTSYEDAVAAGRRGGGDHG